MDNLRAISLFSGVGGLDLAGKWCGVKTVCYYENDRYAQGVLMSRMRSGDLDAAPIWDDVTTFDGKAWEGKADIVCGGFPCQDVSFAGKRAGLKPGTRSGLWNHFARIIREVRPSFVLVENVPGLLSLGLGQVLGDLAEMGMAARWGVWGASDVGAKHRRQRVWIVAHPNSGRFGKQKVGREQSRRTKAIGSGEGMADAENSRAPRRERKPGDGSRNGQARRYNRKGSYGDSGSKNVADTNDGAGSKQQREQQKKRTKISRASGEDGESYLADTACQGCPDIQRRSTRAESDRGRAPSGAGWWDTEPDVGRVAHGVAFRVDRLRCCGNGVVPQQALPAWEEIVRMAGS